ncbi:DUF255 domain-containing protein [Pedobacter sp. HMF7647]|uniref:DUF255 domain-containing protein n=1 Tax=Hufsiella arboris TaxID=2695275 RepID=A0A7K1YC84_9SPHI|nr:thioredoxin domain-containing protein [Hufsiella arboris]MXV52194.1 DUF255 domain-containing protein [Hufsiella arboris]
MPNSLINETSPYLLQHANNPVDWFPWGPEALSKAQKENKLILVSVGYSACHWCHVMEHESFENEQVAEIMNEHFVCIKVDREERPDIDQIYMNAVQLMTGQGGWPMNCFCLPDQRPIYGGTYFRKGDWMNLLQNLAAFWTEKPDEAVEYAVRLTEGIKQGDKIKFNESEDEFDIDDLREIYEPWKRYFDPIEGGYNRAPKFPLPNNWQFMLRYSHLMKDSSAEIITKITLEKIALGGIYDHIGGGFARYSVDDRWHVPHFEKMLYDNAQLVSLYSEAYQAWKTPLYKDIVYETLNWIEREMMSDEGGFYSALDADSEGVEGKFYTFEKNELVQLLGDAEPLFSKFYHVMNDGNWHEEKTNVLFRDETELNEIELTTLKQARDKVFAYRDQRIKPGLDNKILTSWNGMMLKGFADAYRVFDDHRFLEIAKRNVEFITGNLLSADGALLRMYKSAQKGFLDDYAFVIDGLIGLYECTFDENWILQAKALLEYSLLHFSDDESQMLFFTSNTAEELIARKFELTDNVIPASNSVMAINLFKLGHFFDNESYIERSLQMLRNIKPEIKKYGSGYSNWATLLLYHVFGIYEVAITGTDYETKRKELENNYVPNKIILGGSTGTLPLLNDKWLGETKIFVCKNRTCKMPVTNTQDALNQLINQSEN